MIETIITAAVTSVVTVLLIFTAAGYAIYRICQDIEDNEDVL